MSQKHLTKSRHGVYYFQYWIPKRLKNNKYNKKVFRLSLNTSNRRNAVKQSHRLIVIMYDFEEKYYINPNKFGDAILNLKKNYSNMSKITNIESKMLEEKQMRDVGRGISEQIKSIGIDENDIDAMDDFFEMYSMEQLNCYGKYIEYQENIKNVASSSNVETLSNKISNVQSHLISHHLEGFVAHKKWAKSTEIEYRDKIKLFIKIVTDKPISELTKGDVNNYTDTIIRLPSNAHKKPKYKNKTIDEILEMDVPESELIGASTIGNNFSKVSEFLGRMVKNGVIKDRYINEPLQGKVKKKKGNNKDRVPFEPNELKILFESDTYITGRYGYIRLNAARYWIPLISLLSGMRINEICQLCKSDIKKKGDIWYFDINDKGDKKHLKTWNSERLVPIHKELKKLGFIKYVESCKSGRIFPTLTYGVKGHWGGGMSKWYTRYLKKHGVWVKNIKVFHSLRYNFTTIARKGGYKIDILTVKQLVGHGTKNDITDGYTGLDDLPDLNKAVQKIKYDIDFSKIKKWK